MNDNEVSEVLALISDQALSIYFEEGIRDEDHLIGFMKNEGIKGIEDSIVFCIGNEITVEIVDNKITTSPNEILFSSDEYLADVSLLRVDPDSKIIALASKRYTITGFYQIYGRYRGEYKTTVYGTKARIASLRTVLLNGGDSMYAEDWVDSNKVGKVTFYYKGFPTGYCHVTQGSSGGISFRIDNKY